MRNDLYLANNLFIKLDKRMTDTNLSDKKRGLARAYKQTLLEWIRLINDSIEE